MDIAKLKAELQSAGDTQQQFGNLRAENLYRLVRGLEETGWTGMVAIETPSGEKRIFFERGALVFAGSSMIDDRLGEIIYRYGIITLDEWSNSAARVTREKKFGQVLLESEIFTHTQLWKALTSQVRHILDSIFILDSTFVELHPGNKASSQVMFHESTAVALERSYLYGCMYRSFAKRVHKDCLIYLVNPKELKKKYPQGTFIGDMISLIENDTTLGELLKRLKVHHTYSIMALLAMMNLGICTIEGLSPAGLDNLPAAVQPLVQKVTSYQAFLTSVSHHFSAEMKELPVNDLQDLAHSLNEGLSMVLFLDHEGAIDRESAAHMYAITSIEPSYGPYFAGRVDRLMLFAVQISQDSLSKNAFKQIQQEYRELRLHEV